MEVKGLERDGLGPFVRRRIPVTRGRGCKLAELLNIGKPAGWEKVARPIHVPRTPEQFLETALAQSRHIHLFSHRTEKCSGTQGHTGGEGIIRGSDREADECGVTRTETMCLSPAFTCGRERHTGHCSFTCHTTQICLPVLGPSVCPGLLQEYPGPPYQQPCLQITIYNAIT